MKKLTWLCAFLTPLCMAQTYPVKPITVVVPYVAGGVSDALARSLAQKLTGTLNQQVIVENKPGGNTLIGATFVAKAPADGYTLLLTAEATLTMNPMLYAKLPYDVEKNFASIAALASIPQAFVVSNHTNAKDMKEFLALAKKNADKLSYANLGSGSTAHLNFELFEKEVDINLTPVPYKGAAAALNDLLGGHVDAMIVSTGFVSSHAKAGTLKVLAVAGGKRSPLLPDVPTFKEAGIPGFQPSSWFALMGVAGTSPEVIDKLNGEINKLLKDPVFKAEQLDKFILEPIGGSPDALKNLIKSDSVKWTRIIKETQLQLDSAS